MDTSTLFNRLNGGIEYLATAISDINIVGADLLKLFQETKRLGLLNGALGVIMDDFHALISALTKGEKERWVRELKSLGYDLEMLRLKLKLKIGESSEYASAEDDLTEDPSVRLEGMNFKKEFSRALNLMARIIDGYLIKNIHLACEPSKSGKG